LNVLAAAIIPAILEGLKYTPQIVEVGKDVWKHLIAPEELTSAEGKNGIVGNSFYSSDYKFQISIPDDSWRFWKPSPQFIASLGTMYTLPVRDVPIIIMSKNMVRLYRPMVVLTVEDVGSFTNVQELVAVNVYMLQSQGMMVDEQSVKISPNSNSAALIAVGKSPSDNASTAYAVMQIFLYAGKAYYINATYVPMDDKSPQLFGGLQDILNSFKLIK
jgi:hypothetical protein